MGLAFIISEGQVETSEIIHSSYSAKTGWKGGRKEEGKVRGKGKIEKKRKKKRKNGKKRKEKRKYFGRTGEMAEIIAILKYLNKKDTEVMTPS